MRLPVCRFFMCGGSTEKVGPVQFQSCVQLFIRSLGANRPLMSAGSVRSERTVVACAGIETIEAWACQHFSRLRLVRPFVKSHRTTTPFSGTKAAREFTVMMNDHERSLTQIALDCGFSGSSQFSVVFKRVVGVSPRQYRRTL
jgi:AraC-like DNA-binding protein